MAQTVLVGDTDGFPLTLTWQDWDLDPEDDDEYEVVYSLEEVEGVLKLKREHYKNTDLDATTYVAKYIDSGQTSCEFNDQMLTFTVTAIVGGGSLQEGSETRIYEIVPRPDGS